MTRSVTFVFIDNQLCWFVDTIGKLCELMENRHPTKVSFTLAKFRAIMLITLTQFTKFMLALNPRTVPKESK